MKGLIRAAGMFILGLSAIAFGASATPHPLDSARQACLLKNKNMVDLAECYVDVVDEWRDEVERVYEFVIERKAKQGKVSEARLIIQQQESWLKYRQVVLKTWQSSCSGNAACQVQLPEQELKAQRERYYELEAYIDCISCFEPYDG
ncbi:hypothetical protein ACFSJ3_08375 [Corallincola platygyrae]|uniref:Lysozyme inhibitor LprI N-terminal domain-containing protein n=1 Tax=Corallincola platygyrae TaxID=1193278 RepID=A0ABW4XNE7_9GAMM